MGVESCVYLAAQLAELRPHLLAALDGEESPAGGSDPLVKAADPLANVVPDATELVLELRRPVFFTSVVKALQLESALGLMAKVKGGMRRR